MALKPREIALTGRLRTADDPSSIQPNDFQQLQNLRYGNTHPRGCGGQTKVNTSALANVKIKSGIQFRKDQPSESHVLVHATDANDANGKVYRNSTSPPAAGAFTATALWSDTAGAGIGRFSNAPDGKVLYANNKDACIWGGTEARVAGYLDWDAVGSTYKYDYLDAVSNSLTDANNLATVHRYTQSIDANTMLLLHFDNNVTDSSPTTPHTVTNNEVTFSTTYKKFGTHGAYFGQIGSPNLTVPDNADFDFSGGVWTVDTWLYPTSNAKWVWAQGTDANNYISLLYGIDSSAALTFRIMAASSITVTFSTATGAVPLNQWSHVEVVENGDNYYIFVNGVLSAYTSDTDRAANYTGTFNIGAGPSGGGGGSLFKGYMDEFRISNVARHTSSFGPPSAPYGEQNFTDLYIGSTLPLQGIKFYVGTPNATAATAAAYYWDGTNWAAVSSLSDGTSTGGVSLAQTGTMSFTSTASTAKLKIIDDVSLYWYKVQISEVDTTTTISQVTLDAPFQAIKDIWDGEYRSCASFQAFRNSTYSDFTTNVFEDAFDSANEATFAKIGGLTFSTDALYVGSFERLQGFRVALVGGYTNTNACTATVQYWNGSAWAALSADDGTLSNNASFGKAGIMSWTPPAVTAEFKTKLTGVSGKLNVLNPFADQEREVPTRFRITEQEISKFFSGTPGPTSKVSLYYYKITFTGNGSTTAFASDVRAYHIGGIPAQVDVRGYKFPFSHLNRAWLINNVDAEPNAAICAATDTAQVFNGTDSFKYNFGDGTGVVAAASFYTRSQAGISNLALFCKQKETWALAGDTLESIVQYRISPNIGCTAPLTMDVAEVEITANVNRTIAMWQSAHGIVISDGGTPVVVSGDIADKFDPRHANYIGAATLYSCTGWIDPVYNEYHWIIPGTAEWCYDIRRKKWFQISRGTAKYLYNGFPVFDANGIAYSYGVDYAGYLYRLENGTDFDGNDIVHTFHTAAIAPESNYILVDTGIRGVKLIQVAKSTTANLVTAWHYADGDTTGHAIEGSGYSPAASGKSRNDHYLSHRMLGILHSFKYSLTTNDETVGFEPISLALNYEVARLDTRG